MDPNIISSRNPSSIEGRYANQFAIGYSEHEFIFDFGQSYSENDQAEPCIRIVTSPVYAKTLLSILEDSITQYENQFKAIPEE